MMKPLLLCHRATWARSAGLALALALPAWTAVAADAPARSTAGSAKLPPAAEIIAKSIKATGGREAILKHASTRFKGTWSMPAQSVNGDFEMVQAKPNRRAMRMKLGDAGEIVNAYDGKVGWVTSPFAPPTLMEAKMLEQTAEDAEYYSALHDPATYRSIETVALTQFDNRECYEVKLVRKSGREVREYFDVKTGLQAGARSTQESPQGPSEATITLQEYKKFGDLQQPSKFMIHTDQADISIAITSVEYDTVPESAFEAPPDVKALLKK